jgi:hypothetical protein
MCIPQKSSARRSPAFFAAERHGDVDDVPLRFAQQPQRQPANDAFVVPDAARKSKPWAPQTEFLSGAQIVLICPAEDSRRSLEASRVPKHISGMDSQIQLALIKHG